MKRPLLAALCCFVLSTTVLPDALAQGMRKRKPKSGSAETTQWWVGIKGGGNLTKAEPTASYSVFSFIHSPSPGQNEKMYEAFSKTGLQFGFMVGFEFMPSLSVNFNPGYAAYQYEYSNSHRWFSGETASKNVLQQYRFSTRLQYVDLPLTFKYELATGKLKPFVQAGAYYNTLVNATLNTEVINTDRASGSEIEIEAAQLSTGITDRLIRTNWGLLGGAGFTYNIGNARFGVEVNYRHGMNNIVNANDRYVDNQQISGLYDVQDDIQLRNIEFNLLCIIPLKFITSKDYVPL
jgi:hypothetical protein